VDLTHPNAKGKSRDIRFLKRAFLPDEQRQIIASGKPDALLWALWTGKEAAYKVIRKDNPDAPAIPRLYKVNLNSQDATSEEVSTPERGTFFGVVDTPFGTIRLRTFLTHEHAHSIGISLSSLDVFRDGIVWAVEHVSSAPMNAFTDESSQVRDIAKRRLSQYLKVSYDHIEIKRDQEITGLGPPHIHFKGQPAPVDISLSHDGAFIAYAFALTS
jgi:hypothetical protein